MKDSIKPYYKKKFGGALTVTLTYEDADGSEVLQDDPTILTFVYTVEVPRPLEGESVS